MVWLVTRRVGFGLWIFSMLCVLLLIFFWDLNFGWRMFCLRDFCWRQFCRKFIYTWNIIIVYDVVWHQMWPPCGFMTHVLGIQKSLHIFVVFLVESGKEHDANSGPCNVNGNFVWLNTIAGVVSLHSASHFIYMNVSRIVFWFFIGSHDPNLREPMT